jgi:hypothetical protein
MAKVTIPAGMANPLDKNANVKSITPDQRIDEQISKEGKYELTDNDTFRIEIYLTEKDKRWIIVDKPLGKTDGVKEHWVDFRMWTFEEEIGLKKQATNYDPLKRIHFMDNDLLNRLKVQRLMKAWSFEKDNSRLKLLHVNGILSDESYLSFTKLFPSIIRFVLERMNNVLEYNG